MTARESAESAARVIAEVIDIALGEAPSPEPEDVADDILGALDDAYLIDPDATPTPEPPTAPGGEHATAFGATVYVHPVPDSGGYTILGLRNGLHFGGRPRESVRQLQVMDAADELELVH